jgi:AcrR family transcriptional regulator
MAYDSAATRARLLAAAYDEFVEFGLAGARVERIATAASANKQAIYAYFGAKDALFDAVLQHRLQILADLVPFTADDLIGYFGALFDQLVADPGLLRLTQWKALERPAATASERAAHLSKAEALAARHEVSMEDGIDFMMIALATISAWNSTAAAIRSPKRSKDAARLQHHRSAVLATIDAMVCRLLAPSGSLR